MLIGFIALFLISLTAFGGLILIEDVAGCDFTVTSILFAVLAGLFCLAAMLSVLTL